MSAVAEMPRSQIVPADGNSLMEVIARVAADPNADVDKLERLLAMYERIKGREAKASYIQALSAAQQDIPAITERGKIRNKTGGVQSTYALWEDINDVIKPILARHGFALSFRTGLENTKITVTGILSHKDGHSEETTIHLPADTSGSKNDVQGVGSSTSYGKRYTTQALLNMTSRGEDDDGKAAVKSDLVSPEQIAQLRKLIADTGSDSEKFCTYMKVEAVVDIAAKDFERAISALKAKGARK